MRTTHTCVMLLYAVPAGWHCRTALLCLPALIYQICLRLRTGLVEPLCGFTSRKKQLDADGWPFEAYMHDVHVFDVVLSYMCVCTSNSSLQLAPAMWWLGLHARLSAEAHNAIIPILLNIQPAHKARISILLQ